MVLSDDVESSMFYVNKFRIVTPTVDYMRFLKDMQYKYKSLKNGIEIKYSKNDEARQKDLENFYVTSLIEEYNDEINVYKNKVQSLEYCMLARYGNSMDRSKEKRGKVFTVRQTKKSIN